MLCLLLSCTPGRVFLFIIGLLKGFVNLGCQAGDFYILRIQPDRLFDSFCCPLELPCLIGQPGQMIGWKRRFRVILRQFGEHLNSFHRCIRQWSLDVAECLVDPVIDDLGFQGDGFFKSIYGFVPGKRFLLFLQSCLLQSGGESRACDGPADGCVFNHRDGFCIEASENGLLM